jgi:acyl-CoA synthetase (AMP-forming)/AMP-acid ligase II
LSISQLLDMVQAGEPDRVVVVSDGIRVTGAELSAMADCAAGLITSSGAGHVAYVGTGGIMLPLLLFGAARAGRAFTPLNYRLGGAALRELIDQLPAPLVVADTEYSEAVAGASGHVIDSDLFLATTRVTRPGAEAVPAAPDDVAVLLFTSETAVPSPAVELTHADLTRYVTDTVDFGSAEPGDAALICVPPYHIAGVGAALSNLYAGRKMVYLRQFDPVQWLRLVTDEKITNATAVPNGYGLTETGSAIAMLIPADHRTTHHTADAAIAKWLGSVGRAVLHDQL